jgi:hypothetical protein
MPLGLVRLKEHRLRKAALWGSDRWSLRELRGPAVREDRVAKLADGVDLTPPGRAG